MDRPALPWLAVLTRTRGPWPCCAGEVVRYAPGGVYVKGVAAAGGFSALAPAQARSTGAGPLAKTLSNAHDVTAASSPRASVAGALNASVTARSAGSMCAQLASPHGTYVKADVIVFATGYHKKYT